ncbi:MAG: glucoamylase family protein [Vampirovibrionales bacterium]|nr:glucoamylase family protein [Vampirovibrionales bacterium]
MIPALFSFFKKTVSPWSSQDLILDELFGLDSLEQHAVCLAVEHTTATSPSGGQSLIHRLNDNEAVVRKAYNAIVLAVQSDRLITPAAEWLLDNFHLVEEQLRQVQNDLPAGYYRQLPKLTEGHLAGYPRVLGIAWAFIAHTDSLFCPELLCRFVAAYQTVHPLTMGELWAVSISLRILLVENLRRASESIMAGREASQKADMLADWVLSDSLKMEQAAQKAMDRSSKKPMVDAFAVQLMLRMRDQEPKATSILAWIDDQLEKQGTTAEAAVRWVHQRQGATNVTVRNIIVSMRLISQVDWTELFEQMSPVDALLTAHSNFSAMDFPTRNGYRMAIEELAKGSKQSELAVTQAALVEASKYPDDDLRQDPGYYLIAKGRRDFEAHLGYRAPVKQWPARILSNLGIGGYIGNVTAVTALALLVPVFATAPTGEAALKLGFLKLGFLALLGASSAMDMAIALVNRAITKGFDATVLPSLELENGIPLQYRTMVVIPTLLTSTTDVSEQLERLEIHHLASKENYVHYALLTDWKDSDTETAEGDDVLLQAAIQGIAVLNARYGAAVHEESSEQHPAQRFYVLHRKRLWNETQGQWMGWERKRGKLHELNQLLRGSTQTSYMAFNGTPPRVPYGVQYVVTLDSDTRLPLGTVRQMVGKMAHPLNRPQVDGVTVRVVEGYGILQPRVTPSLLAQSENSLFQCVFSSTGGIEPYSAAVSDVYQDLYGEGSYAGKGIYDVDAFEAALSGRTPDNTMLSHDLYEGIFARAGLVSDIEVIEEFPSRYDIASARQHRWARGDWQLLPWLIGQQKNPSSNTLPLMGQWKVFDNLRRSLSAPASMAALLLAFTLPFNDALIWIGFIIIGMGLPTALPLLAALWPSRPKTSLRAHFRHLLTDAWLSLLHTSLLVAFLAHQAWMMLDAIGRTLYRLTISHKQLLEWVTAAQAKNGTHLTVWGYYYQMGGALVIALAALGIAISNPDANKNLVLPFVLLWSLSPAIARWVSTSPVGSNTVPLSGSDAQTLRHIARKTWRFFETFVTESENWLPPDNFQENPLPVIAHRTSPTNMGLYLLSAVSACDLGWAGQLETLERLENTLTSMNRLAQFRGHFFNWYDTQDGRPLYPQYISAVDSGNLAGHLITLANVCQEWAQDSPLLLEGVLTHADMVAGIQDAVTLTQQSFEALPTHRKKHDYLHTELAQTLDVIADDLRLPALKVAPNRVAYLNTLHRHASTLVDVATTLAHTVMGDASDELLWWAEATLATIHSHQSDLTLNVNGKVAFKQRLKVVENTARTMANAMEFGFLLNPARKLLAIGYNVQEDRLDESCYDLLASEARLASFYAIAKGDIPAKHWFRLGRAVTPLNGGAALISWSGSMFEYLMPALVMHAPLGSLLEQTNRLIVDRQIAYGQQLGLPWGVSESAYHIRDRELTYQYSNFGVPGLGLKRGLGDNRVIAPYATALASMINPTAALTNFNALEALQALGRFGFCEALDFTKARVPEGQSVVLVHAYMAHHQGMSILSIANVLQNGRFRQRFHAEPCIQAAEFLLQERMPKDVAVAYPRAEEVATVQELTTVSRRHITSPHSATPEAHVLSNGRYQVMITSAGSGYSQWQCQGQTLNITRWHSDVTQDNWGAYVYLRDKQSGKVWSAGYQPTAKEPKQYEAIFTEDRAEFMRRDGSLVTSLEVMVSSEDDAEVRRISITNRGVRTRELDITSYSELVLASQSSDTSHPAFSKLFVQTRYLPKQGVLLATRRRRAPNEPEIWAAHLSVVEGSTVGELEVETDRARFVGRGGDARFPLAMQQGRSLSNTVGTVLDPIFALRRSISLPPGATVKIAYWTLVASTQADVLALVEKHQDAHAFVRTTTLAWTQAQVQLRHLGIEADEASLFQRLGSNILYTNPLLRPSSYVLQRSQANQSALWSQGISGDASIVLVRIDSIEDIGLVRQVLRAHEYLAIKQLAFDVVVLNERSASYVQDLQIALETLVRSCHNHPNRNEDGAPRAVFLLRSDLIAPDVAAVLPAVARIVLNGRRGSLSKQLKRSQEVLPFLPRKASLSLGDLLNDSLVAPLPPPEWVKNLHFFNGLGGFSIDGTEYITVLGPGQQTPAPWINVIANPNFGFQVAVEGSGYTWACNSRENQLTPWSNDPVSDRTGEAFYIKDEDSGKIWSPTASPIRIATGQYVARHGFGYSQFETAAHGIDSQLLQTVSLHDPIKISRLTLKNTSGRTRRLSVTAYAEWVLGQSRSQSAPYIVTTLDNETGALLAHNPWSREFGNRCTFMDLGGKQHAWTGDRREFIGRNGSVTIPAGLGDKVILSKRVGAGLDPCGVLQTFMELQPNESIEIVMTLGQTPSVSEAQALIQRYRKENTATLLDDVKVHWRSTLGAVQVTTPDAAMNIMLNGWLLYQSLACRVWARSAFYQASGAYGFRDQLQDGMALTLSRPELTREHLLRAAGRQFVEGDVQHWWLPNQGQGVRTHISDDRIWLAYAAAHYVAATGDAAILDEPISFLEGRGLEPGEHDAFYHPTQSEQSATLFEHCARGLDLSLRVGCHGLPLMGTGDWNDGMNRVGEGGEGESVWLGWFLVATLKAFIPIALERQEKKRAAIWKAHGLQLAASLEANAWDGEWYRRGYYDDGTPLGSHSSDECRIDSIAQSWSVLSGAGDSERSQRAMAQVDKQLINSKDQLALLFTPAFDTTHKEPGYIKGYPPGIRENGGQYSHAATWSVMAFAKLGQGEKAMALFSLLNPISHSSTRSQVHRYKVEPYVMAADVYSVAPHVGRGGWTWYTGAAGWLYRAGTESILGLRVVGDQLFINPCIPSHWPEYSMVFTRGETCYNITVLNPLGVCGGVSSATFNGIDALVNECGAQITLQNDGQSHQLVVTL